MIFPIQISNLKSIDDKEIERSAGELDLLVAATSLESRCVKIPLLLRESNGVRLAFPVRNGEQENPDLERHIKLLEKSGFVLSDQNEECIKEVMSSAIAKRGNKKTTTSMANCFVDVTCIPRRKLAELLYAIIENIPPGGSIQLALGYTLARYTPPPQHLPPANQLVKPVHPYFAGWTNRPGLTVTAIVGLGYERGKALGASEYLQAADRFLFIPESPEHRYRSKVEQINRRLIEATGPKRIINYDVTRPLQTLLNISNLISGIKTDSKPVLLPFGPKILFALSLIAAMVHREAAVWYVSGEESEPLSEKPASSHSFALSCTISKAAFEA